MQIEFNLENFSMEVKYLRCKENIHETGIKSFQSWIPFVFLFIVIK